MHMYVCTYACAFERARVRVRVCVWKHTTSNAMQKIALCLDIGIVVGVGVVVAYANCV